MLERFKALFQGGDLAYGRYDVDHGWTVRGSIPDNLWVEHLDATGYGLGVVPVRTDGTILFAAIDIDVDTINHDALYRKVQARRFPLNVFRSKSGGAHLYLFSKEPQSAKVVRKLLKQWATTLGFPSSEIFPKQDVLNDENAGNWINLPYYGGDNTTRYCVSDKGAQTLAEFLDSVTFYDPARVDVNTTPGADGVKLPDGMPPCLVALSQNPLPPGARNSTLFNVAVFYRKSVPNVWQDKVTEHNAKMFTEPLPFKELDAVIKSVGRTQYQYQCDQFPIRDYCDRTTCSKLPHGVGYKPWQEPDAFDDLVVGHLRKLTTRPPRYIIEVNGKDLELELEQLVNFKQFRLAVFAVLNHMISPMPQLKWEQQVRELTTNQTIIAAPEEASDLGLVIERFHEFLSLRNRARNREDILRGLPFEEGQVVYFRLSDFKRHLQQFKLDNKIESSELYLTLRREGCSDQRIRVAGRLISIWSYPLNLVNEVNEDLKVPEFDGFGDEL